MDNPNFDDNRNYVYKTDIPQIRAEYPYISDLIPQGVKVIDLGCGAGDLLHFISQKKKIVSSGLEISKTGVSVCRQRGIECVNASLDDPLPFENDSFDVAICNVTFQMVNYPERVIREMSRVGKKLIISIPNFAFISNRLELLFHGRMPRKMLFGYEWFNTGHIHQMSLKDMKELINRTRTLRINKVIPVRTGSKIINLLGPLNPNLFHHISIFELERIDNKN